MAINTFTAILLDAPGGTEQGHYPGIFPDDAGNPPKRILVRYSNGTDESRVLTYVLAPDAPSDDESHRVYIENADDPYRPGKPDDDDWLIDAPGDAP